MDIETNKSTLSMRNQRPTLQRAAIRDFATSMSPISSLYSQDGAMESNRAGESTTSAAFQSPTGC